MFPNLNLNNLIEKHGPIKAIIIVLIIFTIPACFLTWLGTKIFYSGIINNLSQEINNTASMSLILDDKSLSDSRSSGVSKDEYIGGNFEDKLEYWEIDYKHYWKEKDKDGFYCPRSEKYPFPKIWHRDLIPATFKSIEIRYELKNENNDIKTSSPFVFAIGKDNGNEILRLFIPEEDAWLVGSEKRIKNDSASLLERETPKRKLDEPMQYEGIIEFKINQMGKMLDEFIFDVDLVYKSARTGNSVKKVLRYENVVSPDPNLDNEFSGIDVGFGTRKGYCIKPLSYKIITE